jgi:hypothetical protein
MNDQLPASIARPHHRRITPSVAERWYGRRSAEPGELGGTDGRDRLDGFPPHKQFCWHRIRKGQFKLDKLRIKYKTAPEIWNAVLAA